MRYRVAIADERLGDVGTIVELEPEVAEWFNRDRSCIVLELVAEVRNLDAPPRDRMVRRSRVRKET